MNRSFNFLPSALLRTVRSFLSLRLSSLPCALAVTSHLVLLNTAIVHAAEKVERPNFVLVMSDDQGWGDVAFRGHPHLQTPVMDEMAAEGLRFDRFYAAAPVCSPTRASFLTGRHPNRMGVFSWGHTLRPQEVTLAEALQDAGYATGHFGKWHLGSVREDSPVNPGNSGFDEWWSAPNFYENDPFFSHRGKAVRTSGESSMVTVEKSIPFMEEAVRNNQPFLAVVWFGNPHGPHQATDELKQLYSGLSAKEQNYYGEITGIDRAMGHLRQELKRLGVRDNTLLWYTSDNGPQGKTVGSAGGLRGVKGSLWEGGIRVPAMIEWPSRINENRVVNVPSSTSDIYPTVLDIAGVPSPHDRELDGISLVDVIEGTQADRDKPMAFWVYPERGVRTPSEAWMQELFDEQSGVSPKTDAPPLSDTARVEKVYKAHDPGGPSALIDGDWKLQAIPGRNGTFKYELYNLATDPSETKDVSKSHAAEVNKMSQQLARWRESVIDSLNGKDY